MSYSTLLVLAQAEPKTPENVDAWKTISQSLATLWQDTLAHLPLLAAAIAVLAVTWVVYLIAVFAFGKVLDRWKFRTSLKDLFRQLLGLGIWIVGVLIAAVVLFPGMTPAKIFTVLGIGSIAIGFAFKDIFENFFAGVLILWQFPFEPGDYILCEEIAGTVEDTSIRMTKIRRTNGELVIVPNATLFKNSVQVWTNWDVRRVTVICGVAYDEDVDESREVIRKAVANCKTVNKDKQIEIFAQEFASSSINFEVTWWTGPRPLDERRSKDEVVAAVKRALDTAGIEIPFPYRTLTFKNSPTTVAIQSDEMAAKEHNGQRN